MPMNLVILERRKALGLTQEQIADYLGVSAPAVNKWEKGTTCPDIALLPVLARLLKVDLNTLFGFNKDLTDQEVGRFTYEIISAVKADGLDAGFEIAEEKIREYPNCDTLLYPITLQLEGLLIMSGLMPDEKVKYEAQILSWYERLSKSSDDKIRNGALYMLAGKYLAKKQWDKAQETIDLLPEKSALDKNVLQANFYEQQGNIEEAAKLIQRRLLTAANDVQMSLVRLAELETAMGEHDRAYEIAEISRQAVRLLNLWEYNSCIAPLQMALACKDADESIRCFRQLLEACFLPWNMKDSPLYCRIGKSLNENTAEVILPPLIADLENNPDYEFIRKNRAFEALISEYKEKMQTLKAK